MAAISFPSSPTIGQVQAQPNGYNYTWNGTSWVGTSGGSGSGVGLAGTWHNVTGSRALGVTYTNNFSYPIAISVYGGASSTSGISIVVNGTGIYFNQAQWNGAGAYPGGFTIIPAGATYSVSFSSSGLAAWWELY